MFARPMLSRPGLAVVVPEEVAALSPAEVRERLQLREALRLRRSVDHFARAWYGAIVSLILTGIAAKVFIDAAHRRQPAPSLGGLLLSGMALGGWCFATLYLVRSRRTARVERDMLGRLQDLDERFPKPPELF
jgi:hypothetical protein